MQAVIPRHGVESLLAPALLHKQFNGEATPVIAANELGTYTRTAGASSVSVYRPRIIMIGPFPFTRLPARDDQPAVLDANSLGPRN